MKQHIISSADNYRDLDAWIHTCGADNILLVCGRSIRHQEKFTAHLELLRASGMNIITFSAFQPNPLCENVLAGLQVFRESSCGAIIAAGGGSAMDVAKCIKLWAYAEGSGADGAYLKQEIIPNTIPFLVMPTTAGTGSEATRYAVIYYGGNKQSVTHESCVPDTVLMDPDSLIPLPLYQKKAAMMDAFCHALESFWSVNSTNESKQYSREALRLILDSMDDYQRNTEDGRKNMLQAAYIAGKAINITQTTAGHAMCYKLTSLFGTAHGHAALLCDRVLFPHMIQNTDLCVDPRGESYLRQTLHEIADAMGCQTPEEAAEKLNRIFDKLSLEIPEASPEQFRELAGSVNPVRLKNHPVALNEETIDRLYHKILKERKA